jgi:two-component system CheB/CheR fusion protein
MPHRILIVEDYDDAREAMAELIRLWGHETETAASGAEASRKASEFLPDVVLLDLDLPDLLGSDIARELRAGGTGGPFVIATTGYGRESDRARAMAAGCDAFFVKPFDVIELEKVLSTPRTGLRGRLRLA